MSRSEILAPAPGSAARGGEPQPADAAELLSPDPLPADRRGEAALRPRSLEEFVGQSELKATSTCCSPLPAGAGSRSTICYSPARPASGKTTLSHIVAHELGAHLQTTSGPALERAGDLAAMLTKLEPGDVLFIDEMPRLPRARGRGALPGHGGLPHRHRGSARVLRPAPSPWTWSRSPLWAPPLEPASFPARCATVSGWWPGLTSTSWTTWCRSWSGPPASSA